MENTGLSSFRIEHKTRLRSPLLHMSGSYEAAKRRLDSAQYGRTYKNRLGYMVKLDFGWMVEKGDLTANDIMSLSTLEKQLEYSANHDMESQCDGGLSIPRKYEEFVLCCKGMQCLK